jgi:hypothetical protein
MTAQCQKEAHTSTLLSKFKMKCIIFTQELESCFQGTTHKNTLFTLKLDLNVSTIAKAASSPRARPLTSW